MSIYRDVVCRTTVRVALDDRLGTGEPGANECTGVRHRGTHGVVCVEAVLVVANLTAATPDLLDAVKRYALERPTTFALLIPTRPRSEAPTGRWNSRCRCWNGPRAVPSRA